MKTINNINFDTTIRVLFKIKEKKGHKTLQETYKYLNDPNMEIDNVLDIVLIELAFLILVVLILLKTNDVIMNKRGLK